MSTRNSKRIRYNYAKCKDCGKPVRDKETKRCSLCFDAHRRQKVGSAITCSSCEIELPLLEFAIRTDRGTYYKICKICRREQRQRWKQSESGKLATLRYKRGEKHKAYRAAYEKTERRMEFRRRANRRRRQTPKGRLQARIHCAQRRARLAKASGTFTDQDWADILSEQDNNCAYCGYPFTDSLPPTMDHKTPISRGGAHDRSNIVASCKPCNSKKWTKTYEEYLQIIRNT